VDGDKYPQPVINFENSTAIGLNRDHSFRKTLQRGRSKGYDKLRIYRYDFVKQPMPAYFYLAGVGTALVT
jgi:hypothetical protein